MTAFLLGVLCAALFFTFVSPDLASKPSQWLRRAVAWVLLKVGGRG